MTFPRPRLGALLLAACFAACHAGAAVAAGEPLDDHGPGMHGRAMGGEDMPGMGAMEGMGGRHHGMGGGMMMQLHRLNLSDAQRDKLFAIMHNAAPEAREHMKAMRKARATLAELAHADRFDDARANAASRDLGQAVAAAALLHTRTAAQALAVLTPEQREQLRHHRGPGMQWRPHAREGAAPGMQDGGAAVRR